MGAEVVRHRVIGKGNRWSMRAMNEMGRCCGRQSDENDVNE